MLFVNHRRRRRVTEADNHTLKRVTSVMRMPRRVGIARASRRVAQGTRARIVSA